VGEAQKFVCEQSFPIQPAGHAQVKSVPEAVTEQTPVFLQGFTEHGVVDAVEQSFPVHPVGQVQLKSDAVPTFVQTPPFAQVPATEQMLLIEQSFPDFPAGH
jgi:hypothetical protein